MRRSLMAGVAAVMLVSGCSGTDTAATTVAVPAATAVTSSTAAPPTTTLPPPTTTRPPAATTTSVTAAPTTTSTMAGVPDELLVDLGADVVIHTEAGLGSVWATGVFGPDPYLYEVDPATGTVANTWALETVQEPGTLSLAVGDRHVWVVLRSTVARIDPASGEVDYVDFGKGPVDGSWLEYPWTIAAGEGAAWVAVAEQGDGFEISYHLYRIESSFGSVADAVTGHVELGPGFVADLLADRGRVWALVESSDTTCALVAIDAVSVSVIERIELSGDCDLRIASLAEGEGYVFVADWGGRVRWVDTVSYSEVKQTGGDSTGLVAFSDSTLTLWTGAYGRDFGLGGVLGSRSGGLDPRFVAVYDRHAGDLAVTDDALWLIVDEPHGLLRVSPEPIPQRGPDSVGDPCSATGVNIALPSDPGLPAAVDEMRRQIRDAAWACDIDHLADLALPGEFLWSFNPDADPPAEFWRWMEFEFGASPMRAILEMLALPSAVRRADGVDVQVWPGAAAYEDWADVPAEDRAALAGLFYPEDLERFEGDGVYLGPSVGIDVDGDWRWFVMPGN